MSISSQRPPLIDFNLIDPEGKETVAEQIGELLQANNHSLNNKLLQQLLGEYQEWLDDKASTLMSGPGKHWLGEAQQEFAAMAAENERQLAQGERRQLPPSHPANVQHAGVVVPFEKDRTK